MELMTPAPSCTLPPEHLPTGNLEVHVEARPKAPAISRLGVASLGPNGLLDWVGEPLLEVSGQGWQLSRISDWIPPLENKHLAVTLLAPFGERGLVLRLEPKQKGLFQVAGNLG